MEEKLVEVAGSSRQKKNGGANDGATLAAPHTLLCISAEVLHQNSAQVGINGDRAGAGVADSIGEDDTLSPSFATPQKVILSGHSQSTTGTKAGLSGTPVKATAPSAENAVTGPVETPCRSPVESAAAEIHELAKGFCRNQRVATKYTKDREKITAFLRLIAAIAKPNADPTVFSEKIATDNVHAETEFVTFTRTVEELSEQSGLTVFEVDKYLRWAAKGLQILECAIPKDKQVRERLKRFSVACRGH